MKRIIKNNLSGNKVLTFFILANIVYLYMLTFSIPVVMRFSGGMKLPDMMPAGYNVEYINTLMDNLGEEGRQAYLFRQIPADMVFPLLFAISWCLVVAWFLSKLGKLDGRLIYLCYIPVLAGFFDYLENTGIILILTSFPANPDIITHVTNVFTVAKSFLTTIHFVAFIIVSLMYVVRRFRRTL